MFGKREKQPGTAPESGDTAVAERPATAVWLLLLLAVLGLGVIGGLAHLRWRRRLRETRKPMVLR